MDKEKYLNDELKEYYNNDFKKVLNIQSSDQNEEFKDGWEIDMLIRDQLININANNNIATLYSKFPNNNKEEGLLIFDPESYLRFCYKKEVELKLFRDVISGISQLLYNNESKFYYIHKKNKANVNVSSKSKRGIGCIDDSDYFDLNYIQLYFISDSSQEHIKFWKFLEVELSKIQQS